MSSTTWMMLILQVIILNDILMLHVEIVMNFNHRQEILNLAWNLGQHECKFRWNEVVNKGT